MIAHYHPLLLFKHIRLNTNQAVDTQVIQGVQKTYPTTTYQTYNDVKFC